MIFATKLAVLHMFQILSLFLAKKWIFVQFLTRESLVQHGVNLSFTLLVKSAFREVLTINFTHKGLKVMMVIVPKVVKLVDLF